MEIQSLGFRVSSSGFRVPGLKYRVPGFKGIIPLIAKSIITYYSLYLESGICSLEITSKRWAAQQNLEKQPHFDSFLTLSVFTDNLIPIMTGTLTRQINTSQTIIFDTYSP
jgi:hypothetical protein